MIKQSNFKVVRISFAILFIKSALCFPAPSPDDFLSLGFNYLTKTAKSPNFGLNKLLFPFSDLQSRIRNGYTERSNIQGYMKNTLHPWHYNRYNVEKDRYDEQYRPNTEFEEKNTQQNIFTKQNNGNLLSKMTPASFSRKSQATEISVNPNQAIEDNDLNIKHGTEYEFNSETTTDFTSDAMDTTTESDDLSNRIAPQVVATLLG
ncbi:uncharacterized protein LOC120625791 [Pararge aegeria]|uniref:Jg9506 protein n=1 Tax=Pararge aegeria aegeria TaxID=348720 RepID=A0A8S4RK17_9NEOP|nr:uncharacterized protein LOC120625791 [Pararge aegeria]CAH2237014.1 jg9506 [Pararge aegeria aegeria]